MFTVIVMSFTRLRQRYNYKIAKMSWGWTSYLLCLSIALFAYMYIYIVLTDHQICRIFRAFGHRDNCIYYETLKNTTLSPEIKLNPVDFLANYTTEDPLPKIMHHMDTLHPPKQVVKWLNTWVEHYPDWTHVLWHDEEIDKLLATWKYPTICNKHIERLDYSRYIILWTWGGIYKDSDIVFQCRPNMYLTGISIYQYSISNAYMTSPPKEPVWLDIFDHLSSKPLQPLRGPDFINTCGPIAINKILENNPRVVETNSNCIAHISTDRWGSESRRYDILHWYFIIAVFINIICAACFTCKGNNTKEKN